MPQLRISHFRQDRNFKLKVKSQIKIKPQAIKPHRPPLTNKAVEITLHPTHYKQRNRPDFGFTPLYGEMV